MQNADVIETANSTFDTTLMSDFKDNVTHGICVSNLTYLTARKMGLDEGTCYDLALAGLVHDIGKLQLSRYLYGRAVDSFEMEGMKYMRLHSKLSYDILQYYDFSPFILQAVLYHHENYDGTGYPENLKGDDIPFGARVMRVADTFTALISDRPYRKALDIDTAMEIMIDEVSNYDMEVFIAFQKVIHEPETLEVIKSSKSVLGFDFDEVLTNNKK
ncbi:MAG: HD-GYP domain-containing protein [Butyrivibrio sp.]